MKEQFALVVWSTLLMGVRAARRHSELCATKVPVRTESKTVVVNLSTAIQMYRRMPSRFFSTIEFGISHIVAEEPTCIRTK